MFRAVQKRISHKLMKRYYFYPENEKCFTNLDGIRIGGNEAREGRNETPPSHMLQYQPFNEDKEKIAEILRDCPQC